MSTLRLETHVPKAGVNKPKSRLGLMWDRLTKPAEEPPYRQLPEYHIRVLQIKPGTAQHPLRGKLKVVDPRKFKYIALSYTWEADQINSTVPARSVLVGGTDVAIRPNLYDALCQVRDSQSDVPVFVDALCINFNDHHERADYIEIMGHIYARAASVIIWLGKKDKESDQIMLIMRKLVNAIDWRKLQRDGSPMYNLREPRFFQNMGLEPLTLNQWRQILDFCEMRWFTRYWSFFELALAKNALFLWGEACMEYNFVIDFGMILGISGWLDDLPSLDGEATGASSNALMKMLGPVSRLRGTPAWHPKSNEYTSWMRENFQLNDDQQRAWKFFEIMLQSAEALECGDQRDRLYAPLAYARHIFGGKSINKQWPRPDYHIPAEQVANTFCELIYQQTGQQSILATEVHVPQEYQQLRAASRDGSRGRTGRQRRPFG